MVTNAKLLSPGCVDVRLFILPQPVERCHTIGGGIIIHKIHGVNIFINATGETYFMEKGYTKVC